MYIASYISIYLFTTTQIELEQNKIINVFKCEMPKKIIYCIVPSYPPSSSLTSDKRKNRKEPELLKLRMKKKVKLQTM